VEGVNPGIKDAGAGLRISGRRPVPEISGTSEWQVFTYEFQLEEETQVEFVCELRAVKGKRGSILKNCGWCAWSDGWEVMQAERNLALLY
jgi:hypothetical protein